MLLDIEPKPLNKISSGTILQQTPFWGRVKSIQGWEAQAFDLELEVKTKDQKGRNIKEDLLIISKDIGDGAEMAYIPYGPMTLPDKENRGLVLEELSENLRPYLSDNCIMIRYDLPWESPWAE